MTSWREAPGAQLDPTDDDELADQLAERFTDAVERQMMSDVPYGAFLSGGVDSAGVVAAMKRRAEAAPTTFTIGFPGHGDVVDERKLAAGVCAHHRHRAPRHGDARDRLPHRAARATMPRLEEPCGIPSAPGAARSSRASPRST